MIDHLQTQADTRQEEALGAACLLGLLLGQAQIDPVQFGLRVFGFQDQGVEGRLLRQGPVQAGFAEAIANPQRPVTPQKLVRVRGQRPFFEVEPLGRARRHRIDFAREAYGASGARFERRDLRQPLDDLGRFDFVWVRFVLEYFLADAFEVVSNISGILKPGATLCLVDLDYNCLTHYGLSERLERTFHDIVSTLQSRANFDPFAGRTVRRAENLEPAFVHDDQVALAKLYLHKTTYVLQAHLARYRRHPGSWTRRAKEQSDLASSAVSARRAYRTWLVDYVEQSGIRDPLLEAQLQPLQASLATPGAAEDSTAHSRLSGDLKRRVEGSLVSGRQHAPVQGFWRAAHVRRGVALGGGFDPVGAGLGDPAVVAGGIADDAVTQAKIANDAVDAARIAAGAVGADALASDAVDDTKVGNRVPQFYRRQGGGASDWSTAGTTTYTPTTVRMQAGSVSITLSSESSKAFSITFPTAFSNVPVVFCQWKHASQNYSATVLITSITASGFGATFYIGSSTSTVFDIYWMAVGPE